MKSAEDDDHDDDDDDDDAEVTVPALLGNSFFMGPGFSNEASSGGRFGRQLLLPKGKTMRERGPN
jgi:hypothetical protein